MKKLLKALTILALSGTAYAGQHVMQNDPSLTIGSMTLTTNGAGIKFADGTTQTTAGGGGGSSALEVLANGVRISSPTSSLSILAGSNVTVTGSLVSGTTAQITIAATGGGGGSGGYNVEPATVTFNLAKGVKGSTTAFSAFNTTTTSMTVTGSGGLAVVGSGWITTQEIQGIPSALSLIIAPATAGYGSGATTVMWDEVGNTQLTISDNLVTTNRLTVGGNLTISSGVILAASAGTNGQVLTSGGPGTVPTWTTVSGGGGGSGQLIYPSTGTPSFPFGVSATTGVYTSTVTALALTLNGSGNPSFTKNGDSTVYQIVGSSTVPTAGQPAIFTSSMAVVGTGLRSTLLAVDANGVLISSTVTGGGGGGGSTIGQGTFASLPGTCTTADLYFFTDSLYTSARCSATNTWTYFKDGKSAVLPSTVSWSWNNQTATGVASSTTVNGFTEVFVPGTHTGWMAVLYSTAPTAPYTRTFNVRMPTAMIVGDAAGTYTNFEFGFRDDSNKYLCFRFFDNGSGYQVDISSFSDANTQVGTGWTSGNMAQFRDIYIKLGDDSTNTTFAYSLDGINFRQVLSSPRTAYLSSPKYLFFGAGNYLATLDTTLDVISFQ